MRINRHTPRDTAKTGRWRTRSWLLLTAALVLGGPAQRLPGPAAQASGTRYTFTRMADHGFLQVVEGSGTDPVAQFIEPWGPSINDDGVVAFGHAVEFPLNRTVVSVSDGATISQVHGGGFKSPATDILGIDGHGQVYHFASPPDPSCPLTTNHCIVRQDGVVIASASGQSTPRDFLVNGAHPRLQAGASRVVYYADTAIGIEYRTEAGLVAASGSDLSGIVAGAYDINASGEIVFLAQTVNGFGIFAGRAGEAIRTVFLNYNNPSGIGFASIHGPRIDDSGAVFFSATEPGEQQYKVYRIDRVSVEPVLLVDGNTGPLVLPSSVAVAVNGAGTLAFLATRGLGGLAGIYTGPDPVAHKVVEVGDVIDGRSVVDLILGERAINNNGVGGLGQIVFAVRFEGDDGYSLYRADPPGATADNPVLPLQKQPGVKTYKFARKKTASAGGTVSYWDPPFAIGYEYTVEPGDPLFQSVIPPSFPTHTTYELQLWDGAGWVAMGTLTGDTEHVFAAGGVDRFRIAGIPESLGLELDDPVAFVTGLRFIDTPGADTVALSMTVLTAEAAPTLIWATPSPIVYGTPLGGTQLNATSTTAGTFSYAPVAGTVLPAGSHSLSVTFTPDDPQQAVATATTTLAVLPAPLTIAPDDKTMSVGERLPVLTATYSGFVNGDTPASLDVAPVLATTATGTLAGEFPITVEGASDPNYTIQFADGTLTVRNAVAKCWGERDRAALWPLNADGSSVFRRGSSVFIRFRACDARGVPIGTRNFVASFQLVRTEVGTAVNYVNELPLYIPPTPSFLWDPFLREWVYVLSTRELAPLETYTYVIGLSDGSSIELRFGVR